MENNTTCQRLQCYYRSFCLGHLNHLTERLLIGKDQIQIAKILMRFLTGRSHCITIISKIIRGKRTIYLKRNYRTLCVRITGTLDMISYLFPY